MIQMPTPGSPPFNLGTPASHSLQSALPSAHPQRFPPPTYTPSCPAFAPGPGGPSPLQSLTLHPCPPAAQARSPFSPGHDARLQGTVPGELGGGVEKGGRGRDQSTSLPWSTVKNLCGEGRLSPRESVQRAVLSEPLQGVPHPVPAQGTR